MSIKLVNLAHFAVANAKSSSKIVSAAKNVAQLLAFAALVVAICASSASAGVQRCFCITCDVQCVITTISNTYESSFFQEILLRLSRWIQMICKNRYENIIKIIT